MLCKPVRTETGCGPLTAAIVIGQTAGAERFQSDAHSPGWRALLRYPHPSGRRLLYVPGERLGSSSEVPAFAQGKSWRLATGRACRACRSALNSFSRGVAARPRACTVERDGSPIIGVLAADPARKRV